MVPTHKDGLVYLIGLFFLGGGVGGGVGAGPIL
jgi:hypothetical protein